MNKTYKTPSIHIVLATLTVSLLADSVNNIDGNGDIHYGGGGTGGARAPQRPNEEDFADSDDTTWGNIW